MMMCQPVFAEVSTGIKNVNGTLFYYENGEVNTQKNGFVEVDDLMVFISWGKVLTEAEGLVQDPKKEADWYFLSEGRVQTQYTGLALYDGSWFYIENGKLDTKMADFVSYDGGLFYVGAGRILNEVNGLAQAPNKTDWYFLANGQVQLQYTGLALYDNVWFYVKEGKLAENYTGMVEYDGSIFEVVNGMVKNNHTNISENQGGEIPGTEKPSDTEESVVLTMDNWNEYFEIITKDVIVNDSKGNPIPDRQFYFVLKEGMEFGQRSLETVVLEYQYHIERQYYELAEAEEIIWKEEQPLEDNIHTKTIELKEQTKLLAQRAAHGNNSDKKFFIHIPKEINITNIKGTLYKEGAKSNQIVIETEGLISKELEEQVTAVMHEVYEPVFDYFAEGVYSPVICTFTNDESICKIAATSGRHIWVNADYLNAHPKDLGCIIHELIHCAQSYPSRTYNSVPWLVEGMADYGRYVFAKSADAETGWKLSAYAQGQSYKDGYKVTANFLKYVKEHYSDSIIQTLNHALKQDAYSPNIWIQETGYTIDELWNFYAKLSKN